MKKFICVFSVLLLLVCVSSSADEHALTRLEAVDVISQILPSGQGEETFDDTDDATAAYFKKLGIVQGIDGNHFLPNESISKQDFLIMLKLALDKACPDMFYNNLNIQWYYDQNSVSEYAQSYIRFLSSIGVYDGDGYLEPMKAVSGGSAQSFVDMAKQAIQKVPKGSSGKRYGKKPPVLMYHVVGYPGSVDKYLYVTPEKFEEQIKYLYDNGYTFLFPEELSLEYAVSKPIVITLDDGYEETYTNAYRILKKYNAKATLYIFSDAIDTNGYCSSAQLREMSDSGNLRIYSHSKTHQDLSAKSVAEIETEFAESNDKIYNATGREVTSVSYPYGFYNSDVLSQAKRYYKVAFSVNKGGNSMYNITRRTVDGNFSLNQFIGLLK